MPVFTISVVNRDFVTENDHVLPTEAMACRHAIRGALEIGVDEVGDSNPLFVAEVKVASDGLQLARYFVSIGVSQLK